MTASGTALVTAAAVHLGFQATVTTLVYPALARVPTPGWGAAHHAHTRAITPVVAVVYGVLALACGWSVVAEPGGWTFAALGAVAATWSATVVAALLHGRLGTGHDPGRISLLLQVDRLRLLGAALALGSALLAV